MKKSEIFTELSVKLAQLEAKIDWLIEQQKRKEFRIGSQINSTGCLKCGLYTCDGTKCVYSGHQLAKGDFSDSGLTQEWRPSGDINI